MADRVRISDLDFVYISFKEPNKEENWADLKNKVPWAKRVDGVVGFDSAHTRPRPKRRKQISLYQLTAITFYMNNFYWKR